MHKQIFPFLLSKLIIKYTIIIRLQIFLYYPSSYLFQDSTTQKSSRWKCGESFQKFEKSSRSLEGKREGRGSRYRIRFDTGYSKIEKSTERLGGGGIDTGWQGGTQIEVSLRCLSAGVYVRVCVCVCVPRSIDWNTRWNGSRDSSSRWIVSLEYVWQWHREEG